MGDWQSSREPENSSFAVSIKYYMQIFVSTIMLLISCFLRGSTASAARAVRPPRLTTTTTCRTVRQIQTWSNPPRQHRRQTPAASSFSTSTTAKTNTLGKTTSDSKSSNPDPNSNILRLPSGRTLEYHTYGPTSGFPVLYIHGTPDSGATLSGFETRLAHRLNLRWIAPERPGIGESTFSPGRSVLGYPADIRALIRHLGIEQFAILGVSGGTGYALACARAFSKEMLKGVGICAGVGPVEAGFQGQSVLVSEVLSAWREYPREMAAAIDASYVAAVQDPDDPERLERLWKESLDSSFSAEDRHVLLSGDAMNSALRVLRQVYKHGSAAHAEEVRLMTQPWGFRLEDVGFEGVRLWYGELDTNTPPRMGRYMAERLPGAVYREFPGKSHYSIWCEEIVGEMVGELLQGVQK
jgi:pimeloyl-ACP methyl ester carboxylesterase